MSAAEGAPREARDPDATFADAERPRAHLVERGDAGARELCAEWKRLLAAAIPGPWRYEGNDCRVLQGTIPAQFGGLQGFAWTVGLQPPRDQANAELIVWMRNHAEAIIAALERRALRRVAARGARRRAPRRRDARAKGGPARG